MKKIKLNPAKLQLNKEKIANLTQEEMNNAKGGVYINLDPNVDFLSIVNCGSKLKNGCVPCPKNFDQV